MRLFAGQAVIKARSLIDTPTDYSLIPAPLRGAAEIALVPAIFIERRLLRRAAWARSSRAASPIERMAGGDRNSQVRAFGNPKWVRRLDSKFELAGVHGASFHEA